MTQQQLAENLGVTNKTMNELLSGESCDKEKELLTAEKNSLQALEHLQKLEKEKQYLIGILLFVMGIALLVLSKFSGGTAFQDFISGIMLGLSIGVMLTGVFVTVRIFSQK